MTEVWLVEQWVEDAYADWFVGAYESFAAVTAEFPGEWLEEDGEWRRQRPEERVGFDYHARLGAIITLEDVKCAAAEREQESADLDVANRGDYPLVVCRRCYPECGVRG